MQRRARELTGGLGAHSVLECVGHGESMLTAVSIARPGGAVAGDPAPVRAYIEELRQLDAAA